MNKLEAAWKADPDASLETVQEEASSQKDLLRGALRYENAFEYQNVLAPLVQIEADYDKVCYAYAPCAPFYVAGTPYGRICVQNLSVPADHLFLVPELWFFFMLWSVHAKCRGWKITQLHGIPAVIRCYPVCFSSMWCTVC